MKDELEQRRAEKGIVTVKITAGDAQHVKHLAIDAGRMRDPLAVLKARRRRDVSQETKP